MQKETSSEQEEKTEELEKNSNEEAPNIQTEGKKKREKGKSPCISRPRKAQEFKQAEQEEQWKDMDKKAEFYGTHEQTTSKAWDDKEATRAIKDEEIDWLLKG